MTKHRASSDEIRSPVVDGNQDFPYPRSTFQRLRRHYSRLGDKKMTELLTHEMERHERIKKKIEFDKEKEE